MLGKAMWNKTGNNLWALKNRKGEIASIYKDGLVFYYLINKNGINPTSGFFDTKKCKSFKEAIVYVNKILIKKIDKRIKDLNDIRKVLNKK